MAIAKRMAVTLPSSPQVADNVERLKWAEDNGYPDAWFSDSGAPDSLTHVAAIAHHTSTIRIGVAVTPVYTRSPSVLAASANVIAQVLPGRFVMGIGSSSQTIMGQFNGIALDKPLTRVKETAQLVRIMLAGEKTNFEGKTLFSKGYRQAPLEVPPPIYIAALQPKMIEMAAEIGDGVVFNLWPKHALPKMMEHVRIGAERAGKNPDDVEIVNRSMILACDDKKLGRDLFRAAFAPYYATPVYNKFLSWAGYQDAADAISKGWAAKDRAMTAGAMSDAMIDQIAIIGSEEEIRERVQQDAEAGIDTHIVAPFLGAPPELAQRTLQAFTPDRFNFK